MGYTMDELEELKTAYMERHGIVDGVLKRDFLVYYTSYPIEGTTYKVTVNLTTSKEVSRVQLKRYYKKGLVNQGL